MACAVCPMARSMEYFITCFVVPDRLYSMDSSMGQMPDGVCHDTYTTYFVAVLPLEYPIGSFLLFYWGYTMVHATYEASRE